MNERTVGIGLGEMWRLGVVEGIIAILFGIAALFWPGLTLSTLVTIFSVFVIVWGLVEIIKSLVGIEGFFGMWWLTLVFGVFALGVGVYLIRHPHVAFHTFILLIGFTLIVRGIFDLVAGVFDDMTAGGKVLSFIVGIIAIVAGIIVLREPVSGGVAFVWVLGLYALLMGPLMIALSTETRNNLAAPASRR